MITSVVHDTIDPRQSEAFERFAAAWIRLVNANYERTFMRPLSRRTSIRADAAAATVVA
ncbi:hypothetical protein [Nocardioides sp. CER19]|uniref:hypothetical protein n=1 Tax=Nocardioides sp. CER19 TaxID=3038538 RepID=UPI002446C40D|nr:hypothetical protein [Nocardioides sp. CER19]MDH2413123.1 hypothetical protein [Nocardioides sp. CER19]